MYSAACFITYHTAWYHNPGDCNLSMYSPLWKLLTSLHYVTGVQENSEILVRNSHIFMMQCIFLVWLMSEWSKWQVWELHGRIPSSYWRSNLVWYWLSWVRFGIVFVTTTRWMSWQYLTLDHTFPFLTLLPYHHWHWPKQVLQHLSESKDKQNLVVHSHKLYQFLVMLSLPYPATLQQKS